MIDPSQLPDNAEADRQRITELELDAAVILRLKQEITKQPYLRFESYHTPGRSVPWQVENGMCYPGGSDYDGDHAPKPLSEQKWKNFLRLMWSGK